MMKRLFDIVVSLFFLVLLSPVFIFISFWILLFSGGKIFYLQKRVGKQHSDFTIYKFRTMHEGADTKSQLTVGSRDPRVTTVGYYLRKYKLDELPQLLNVLIGNMSLVGPRPEVRKYVDMYDEEQKKVLSVKPGITDYASIQYSSENDLLAASSNPEATYVNEIMPHKLQLNLQYINERNFLVDLKILFQTILKIFKS